MDAPSKSQWCSLILAVLYPSEPVSPANKGKGMEWLPLCLNGCERKLSSTCRESWKKTTQGNEVIWWSHVSSNETSFQDCWRCSSIFCPASVSARGHSYKRLITKLHGAERETASGICILLWRCGTATWKRKNVREY